MKVVYDILKRDRTLQRDNAAMGKQNSSQNRENKSLLKIHMEIARHISVDPNIHHGIPVITGTRVPISIIIGSLAGGMSKEEVMQEYELTQAQVEAALAYANLGYSWCR